MPAEGFEPPTYGLQNRCTTTVLSRHRRIVRIHRAVAHSTVVGGGESNLQLPQAPRTPRRHGLGRALGIYTLDRHEFTLRALVTGLSTCNRPESPRQRASCRAPVLSRCCTVPSTAFSRPPSMKVPTASRSSYRTSRCGFTFAEFDREVERVARGMLACGLEPGERIGIWAPNCAEWLLTMFGAARAGLGIGQHQSRLPIPRARVRAAPRRLSRARLCASIQGQRLRGHAALP